MLKTENLTLHYGGSQILHGISMEAKAGEVTCVMGTNGVGKTSLLKALAGTHPRSGGKIILAGEEVPRVPPQGMAKRGLAVVPLGRDAAASLMVHGHPVTEEPLAEGLAR